MAIFPPKTTAYKNFVVGMFITLLNIPTTASFIFTSVSSDTLTIGDRIQYSVAMIVPKGATVIAPQLEKDLGTFAIKDWTTKTVSREKSDSVSYSYIITNYNVGLCTIPSLPYFIQKTDSTQDSLGTQPLFLRVGSVISTDTANLKELKPQQVTGKISLLPLYILLGIVAIILAIYFGRRLIKAKTVIKKEPPPKPAYDEAIEALADLESKAYISKGMIREYAFELSEILKRYIERRFETNAAELTTEEMIDWIANSPLAAPQRTSLDWFFNTTDPVKFAKWVPDNATLYKLLSDVRDFIEITKPSLSMTTQPGVQDLRATAQPIKEQKL